MIKNHSEGIHEVEWHQCDLRKKLCTYGGKGSPILSKTDLCLHSSSEYPNHIVNLIPGCLAHFRSNNEPSNYLDHPGLLLGVSNKDQTRKNI